MRPLVVVALLLSTAPAHATAWVPEPGHFYLELRSLFVTTDDGFDRTGALRTLRTDTPAGPVAARLYDTQAQLYGEVGVARRLAIVADLALVRGLTLERAGTSDLSAVGVGDLHLGARVLLLDDEVSCALEAKLGVPTGRSDAALPLGTGEVRGELTLAVGHVWQRVPFYVEAALGAQLRGSGTQRVAGSDPAVTLTVDYAPELTYAAEVGYLARLGVRWRLMPRVKLDGRYGTRAPTTDAPAETLVDPVAPASLRFVRVTAGVAAEVAVGPRRRSFLVLDVGGGGFVWGEGLPAARQLSVAVGWKR